jgi:hypothetical protein
MRKKVREHMQTAELTRMVDALKSPVRLDLSVNELRIIVGCFRAVAYLAETEGEPYLDVEATELHKKLEALYEKKLSEKDPRRS